MTAITVMLTVMVLCAAFVGYMGIRNNTVHDYRVGLIDQIDTASKVDITKDRPWMWRYDEFRSITYTEMMLKFWKHIDSFYLDRSFLDPDTDGGVDGDEYHLQGGV